MLEGSIQSQKAMDLNRTGEIMQEGGITLLGILGIVFVVLKLTHVIAWSWWWVLLPFYGGAALVFGIFIVSLILLALLGVTTDHFR